MNQNGFIYLSIAVAVILILGIAGGVYFLNQSSTDHLTPQVINTERTKSPSPLSTDYQIVIPSEYQKEENREYDWVSYKRTLEKEESSILISRKKASTTDPCEKKLDGYPNAKCITVNGYRALDWGSNIPPYPMGPLTFIYTFIHKDVEYQLTFVGVTEKEKDMILSTFTLPH